MNTYRLMALLLAGALCSFAAVLASAQESRTDADSAPASSAVKTALKEATEIISSQTNAAEAELRECLKNIRDKASADAAAERIGDLYREMAEFAEKHQQAIPSLTRMDISEALQGYIVSVWHTLEREALLRQAVVTRFDCEKYSARAP